MVVLNDDNKVSDLKQLVKTEALRLGFSHCGFASNDSLEELRPFYSGFIQQKRYASLEYLETHFEKRLHPELVLDGTKTVIAVLMNYFPPEIIPEEDNFIISKYAYGADYHVVMRKRLKTLSDHMKSIGKEHQSKVFVDSGVVLEKTWAQRCGVGWQGKNTLIINKASGSFFFIGIILTDLELDPDPSATDHCGTCSSCVSACPTGALDTPYQLNITRCISYQTIENNAEIPSELKSKFTDRIYGCDICQDVCPYNRFARPHQTPEFLPSAELMNLRKPDWVAMTETEFDRVFAHSPVKRAGYQRFKRAL